MSMMYSGCAFQIGNYIVLISVEKLRIKSDSLKTEGIVLFLRAFSLDDLDDYEKHFTVMNYAPGVTLKQVRKQSKTFPCLSLVRRSSGASFVTVGYFTST